MLKTRVKNHLVTVLILLFIGHQANAFNFNLKQMIVENKAATATTLMGLSLGGYLVFNYLKAKNFNLFGTQQNKQGDSLKKEPLTRLTNIDYKTLADFTWKNGQEKTKTFDDIISTFAEQLKLSDSLQFSLSEDLSREYIIVKSPLFQEEKIDITLQNFHIKYIDAQFSTEEVHSAKMSSPEAIKYKQKLADRYIIYFIPKNEDDFMLILETILKELDTNQELQQKIELLKINSEINYDNYQTLANSLRSPLGGYLPPLTLYPLPGKHNAEFVLRYFHQLFESLDGLGEDFAPNNCVEVTTVIYYEQGNPKFKVDTTYDSYYDDSECKALYRPDFIQKGIEETYELNINPESQPGDSPVPSSWWNFLKSWVNSVICF
jgi:hypothetical protein